MLRLDRRPIPPRNLSARVKQHKAETNKSTESGPRLDRRPLSLSHGFPTRSATSGFKSAGVADGLLCSNGLSSGTAHPPWHELHARFETGGRRSGILGREVSCISRSGIRRASVCRTQSWGSLMHVVDPEVQACTL